MKKFLIIAPILFLLLAFNAQKSYACSCAFLSDPLEKQVEDAFNNSAAIFSGKILRVSENPKTQDKTVKIRLTKTWKGKFSKSVTIKTNDNSGMCGYDFEVGKNYLIYTYGEGKELRTNSCTRTALIDGNNDFAVLDKLKKKP